MAWRAERLRREWCWGCDVLAAAEGGHAGHVLLVEVTKQFFAAHEKAIFVLKGSGNLHVGPDGKVVN